MGNFAIRGGYYYDPAPAPDETLNILVPSFNFNSIAGGFGYKSGGLSIDFALEYLMGKDRTVSAGAMPGALHDEHPRPGPRSELRVLDRGQSELIRRRARALLFFCSPDLPSLRRRASVASRSSPVRERHPN